MVMAQHYMLKMDDTDSQARTVYKSKAAALEKKNMYTT